MAPWHGVVAFLSPISFLKNKFYLFIFGVQGLCCFQDFSLVAASRGYSPVAVGLLFIAVASFAVELRL